MELRCEPTEASLSAIKAAIEDRHREVAAGRWLAFGCLLLFFAGFAAVAGVCAAVGEHRFGLDPRSHRLVLTAVFAVQVLIFLVLGRAEAEPTRYCGLGRPIQAPARAFVLALGLAGRAAPRPSRGVIREAAALLDAGADPAALARRVGGGGVASIRALALLEALGLLRHRSLRRASSRDRARPARVVPGVPRPQQEPIRHPPVVVHSAEPIRGLRENWVWEGSTGVTELHCAPMAGWVVASHDGRLTSLGVDASERWSRAVERDLVCVHVAPDGAAVAMLSAAGRITILAGTSGERLSQIEAGESATSVAVTVGGSRIWVGDRFGKLVVFDGRGRGIREVEVGHPIDFVAVASEVEVGIAASRRGHVSSIGAAANQVRRTLIRADLQRVWIEEKGERALAVASAEGILAWDLDAGSLETYALDRAVRDAATDGPGDRLAALTFDDRLVILDAGARVLWQCDSPKGASRIRLSTNGGLLWCVDGAGAVHQHQVLDRDDAEHRAIDLGGQASTLAGAALVEPVREPEPGGFRRVLLDRRGATTVLLHPEGRVAVQRGQRTSWRVSGPSGTGIGDAAITGDGSAVGVIVDQGVRRVAVLDGAARTAAIPALRLAVIPGGGDLLVATAHGELWSMRGENDIRIATDLLGLTQVVGLPLEGSWHAWWARRDGSIWRLDPEDASSTLLVDGNEVRPPVKLTLVGEHMVLVDAAGALRWFTADGRELNRLAIPVPVVDAEAAGTAAVAVTDCLGQMHLVRAEAVAGLLPRSEGLLRAGADPSGEPWLIRVHRQTLLCQGWDGSVRERVAVSGIPLDLASGTTGSWALLTTAGLFSRGTAPDTSNERARYLEL